MFARPVPCLQTAVDPLDLRVRLGHLVAVRGGTVNAGRSFGVHRAKAHSAVLTVGVERPVGQVQHRLGAAEVPPQPEGARLRDPLEGVHVGPPPGVERLAGVPYHGERCAALRGSPQTLHPASLQPVGVLVLVAQDLVEARAERRIGLQGAHRQRDEVVVVEHAQPVLVALVATQHLGRRHVERLVPGASAYQDHLLAGALELVRERLARGRSPHRAGPSSAPGARPLRRADARSDRPPAWRATSAAARRRRLRTCASSRIVNPASRVRPHRCAMRSARRRSHQAPNAW